MEAKIILLFKRISHRLIFRYRDSVLASRKGVIEKWGIVRGRFARIRGFINVPTIITEYPYPRVRLSHLVILVPKMAKLQAGY